MIVLERNEKMRADYIITKTGIKLAELLRNVLSDEMNMQADHIGMCMPGQEQNFSVCIYLYDIRKNADIQSQQMVTVSATELRYPSSYYDLYYIIIPHSDSDLKYKAEEELKLLDIIIQYLGDTYFLDTDQKIRFELCDIDFDSKTKIWTGLNQPLQTAVYCKAGPVEVQSLRTKKVSRVTEVRMDFIQEEK